MAETTQALNDVIAISEALGKVRPLLLQHGVDIDRYRFEIQMVEGGDSEENPLRRTGRHYVVTRTREDENGEFEMRFIPTHPPDGTHLQTSIRGLASTSDGTPIQ
jgi:hypothetical protein